MNQTIKDKYEQYNNLCIEFNKLMAQINYLTSYITGLEKEMTQLKYHIYAAEQIRNVANMIEMVDNMCKIGDYSCVLQIKSVNKTLQIDKKVAKDVDEIIAKKNIEIYGHENNLRKAKEEIMRIEMKMSSIMNIFQIYQQKKF